MPYDLWSHRRQVLDLSELETLSGYRVMATDGPIGTVDQASDEAGDSYLIVRVGTWIFSKSAVLPAGTIARVDHLERSVYVDRDLDEVRKAPRFDEQVGWDPAYRTELDDYYGRAGM